MNKVIISASIQKVTPEENAKIYLKHVQTIARRVASTITITPL